MSTFAKSTQKRRRIGRLGKRREQLVTQSGLFLFGLVAVICLGDHFDSGVEYVRDWSRQTGLSSATGASSLNLRRGLAGDNGDNVTTQATTELMTTTAYNSTTANSCGLTWSLDEWAYEEQYSPRKWLNVAVYAIAMLYLFLGIAVICDDYFCVALEVICAKLNLSEQVRNCD